MILMLKIRYLLDFLGVPCVFHEVLYKGMCMFSHNRIIRIWDLIDV